MLFHKKTKKIAKVAMTFLSILIIISMVLLFSSSFALR